MGAYASLAFLLLGGWAALYPAAMPWAYVAAFVAFELWLARQVRSAGRGAVAVLAPPYNFSVDEAALVERYRFYFTYPSMARESSSVLAALGLSSLVLAPWLTFKLAFVPAALIGLNLFAVSRLTRVCAPLLGLRIAASRGDRAALTMLEVHEPAWAKIRAANADATAAQV
jgi:hypothetical protein